MGDEVMWGSGGKGDRELVDHHPPDTYPKPPGVMRIGGQYIQMPRPAGSEPAPGEDSSLSLPDKASPLPFLREKKKA